MNPTPEERAKNIICRFSNDPDAYIKLTDDIAAQIREAEEAVNNQWDALSDKMTDTSWKEGYKKGFLACREKAVLKAKAVSEQVGSNPNHRLIIGTAEIIGTNIRSLQPNEEKG